MTLIISRKEVESVLTMKDSIAFHIKKFQTLTISTSQKNAYQGSKSCGYIELHFEQ